MTVAEATEGTLLDGQVIFRQPAEGYRSAIDPIFLAAAVPARAGDRIVDYGIGAGAAALCLLHRVPGCTVVGAETNTALGDLAKENAAANGQAHRLQVVDDAHSAAVAAPSFDHVMSNPPYWAAGTGTVSPHAGKANANHDSGHSIGNWVEGLCALSRPKGTVTVIFPAARLDHLVQAFAGRAGGVTICPLWPKAGREAKRVLVQARPGGKGPARLLPGLVLHEVDGRYTQQAEAVLRHGRGLEPLA